MSNEITLVINGIPTDFVRKDSIAAPVKTGPEVIVRTYSAGVHIGTIKERNGREVTLTNARILWSWKGALTLREVATSGVDRKLSKISANVPEVILLEAIEIIPVVAGVDLTPNQA